MEARQHILAQVVVVTQRTPAPAYNAVAVSRDHAGLQQEGQHARPHRLTTPRPSVYAASDVTVVFTVRLSRPRRLITRRTTCPSAPAYNATADSSVCAASDVAVVFTVRLSRLGLHQHIGPHLSA